MSSLVRPAQAVVPRLEVRQLSKRFGGVQALDRVDVSFVAGEVHALVGENGAGKSTLGRVVQGVHRPDGGSVHVDGEEVTLRSPADALKRGITGINQEIALEPARTVVDNVFLGSESRRLGLLNRAESARRLTQLTQETGFTLDPRARVGTLRLADQLKVEILRAVGRDARLIVFDEPTAALSEDDSQLLVGVIRELAERGTTIIFVSHLLKQVLSVADRISILRNGRLVRTRAAAEETERTLVEGMLGRPVTWIYPERRPPADDAPTVLECSDLSRDGGPDGCTLNLRAGEIVGLAGLVGSGRTELARLLVGADRARRGHLAIDGRSAVMRSPRTAQRLGLVLLPESRKDQGLLLRRSIVENVSLPHLRRMSRRGFVDRKLEWRLVRDALSRIDVRGASLDAPVGQLSGGNQQKTLFAKWLFDDPKALIADEPTRGVDIGAKMAIYELLVEAAAGGMGILLISSETEELLGLAHRILVMRGGQIVAELGPSEMSEVTVMHAAFGTSREAQPRGAGDR